MHEILSPEQLYLTVDILVLTVRDGKLCLMLSRRKDPPYEGRLALPGRFIEYGEAAETAVRRLMDEMIPVPEPFMEQLYTFTEVNRDPRGRVISMAYLVIVPPQKLGEVLSAGRTVMEPYAISTDATSLQLTGEKGKTFIGGDLAFDHGRIIETGVQRLQGKIDYTAVLP